MTGDVLITKNPCSHPGDVRLLKAVDKNEDKYSRFGNLFNVIVFSTKGERPDQHMMNGGDLDGDVYIAIWDKSIMEHVR